MQAERACQRIPSLYGSLLFFVVLFVALLMPATVAQAHPGALAADGCHNNRSTGQRHCHNSEQAGSAGYVYQAQLQGKVVAVTDGDTIKVLDADQRMHRVRLNGIDAPERDQPYGSASRDYLAAMVAGQQVEVRSVKVDRYGRLIGNVWVRPRDCNDCGRTLFTNHAMVLGGMAWWYRYYADDQSAEDRGRFESAEKEARARGWGLWTAPDPVPPWVWRRRK